MVESRGRKRGGPSPGTQTHVRPLSSRGPQIIHRDTKPVATTAARATAESEPSTEEPTVHCLHRLCGYWLRCAPLVCCADLLLRNSSASRTRCFAPVGSIVILFSGDRCIRDFVYLRNHSHWLIYNKMYISPAMVAQDYDAFRLRAAIPGNLSAVHLGSTASQFSESSSHRKHMP